MPSHRWKLLHRLSHFFEYLPGRPTSPAGGGKTLAGSFFGGIEDTQEMMDFAEEHNLTPEIELISADYVNKAMDRLVKSDVRYRFVIDIANTLKPIN